jgi:hypothetical protein
MARTSNWVLGLLATGLVLATMTACGSDDDDNSGGSAGSGGATGGTGGATGGTGGATGGTGGATGGTGGATGGTGGATGGTGGATGGTGGATGGTGGATGGTGGATGGTGGGGDDDNDCDHATDISTTGTGEGEINPPDESDFYSFPFTEGDWVILRATTTTPNNEDPDTFEYKDVLDTTITVYDANDNIVASMDDAFPRVNTNTELVWRVPATGTYCIEVADWAAWAGETRPDPPTGLHFEYELGLYDGDSMTEGGTVDTEPNDDAEDAQLQSFAEFEDTSGNPLGIYSSQTMGTLASSTDVDVFVFTMPAGTVMLSVEDFTTPNGPGGPGVNGNGSTLNLGHIAISNADGTSILARLDASKGSSDMSVPLETGVSYLLWVNRAAGTTAGANDFYNLSSFLWNADNPRETETTAGENDVFGNAETITLTASTTNPKLKSGYLLGLIDGSDVDYFGFTAAAGDTVSLACGAIRSGSGLLAPVFAIHGPADAELQKETEVETKDILWSNEPLSSPSMGAVAIATAGTHYVRVTAAGQSSEVEGNYYRCGVHVTSP